MKPRLLPVFLLLLLGCVALPPIAIAQQTPRHLLGSRYAPAAVAAALVPHADWAPYPRTPDKWRAAVPAALLETLVQAGEAALTHKFESISATVSLDYVRTGDRTRHSKISNGKRDALLRLVIAESIEDKGRFTEAILNGLWSICEESYWGVPAHIGSTGLPDVANPVVDLFAAETAALVALTDYFVGAKLDKINRLLRARIYHETNRRIFVPMLTRSSGYGWMSQTRPVNNWNPWIVSNWIGSTLFLEKDPARRAEMIHAAMLALDLYLNSLGDDGGCDEGPGYWNAAGASTFDCLELLGQATRGKVDLFAEPLVRHMASYIYKAHIAGPYYINFADAGPKTNPDGHMIHRFGQAIQDPQMVQFGLWLVQGSDKDLLVDGSTKFRKLANLLHRARLPAAKSTYQPVRDAWIADIQVLTARSERGLFLGTHGGHNDESHNHNDVGDFVLYADGEPIIVDAGAGTYTSKTFSSRRYDLWYTQSNYHNLPIINGRGQSAGRAFGARDVTCRITPETATLAMDLAPAYAREAGVTTWKRRVTLDRQKNSVDVLDDFELRAATNTVQQAFVTVATVDLAQPGQVRFTGANQARVTLSYDPALWTASVDQPPQEGPDYGSIPGKWDGRPVRRVLLTHRAPGQKGQVRYVFEKP
jgi:hypothetical protein